MRVNASSHHGNNNTRSLTQSQILPLNIRFNTTILHSMNCKRLLKSQPQIFSNFLFVKPITHFFYHSTNPDGQCKLSGEKNVFYQIRFSEILCDKWLCWVFLYAPRSYKNAHYIKDSVKKGTIVRQQQVLDCCTDIPTSCVEWRGKRAVVQRRL